MSKKKPFALLFLFFILPIGKLSSWGFWAHERINRMAVFTLPEELIDLYKPNIEYITAHAVDPDKRRYGIAAEAPRHYIDLDHYGAYPYENIPRKWKAAVEKYTEDSLNAYGIVPWHVELMLRRLTASFKQKNKRKILQLSAEIGHYIADAHVPLHTTENYNGQLTGQHGIHGFWESRIPELLNENYDYWVGKPDYISRPNAVIWNIVLTSNLAKDSVLLFEQQLTKTFDIDKKYSYETRGAVQTKVYSAEFTKAYNTMLNGMVERRMKAAISAVGSFWYTAWVDAGQPNVSNLPDTPLTEEELKEEKEMEEKYKTSKAKGKGHED